MGRVCQAASLRRGSCSNEGINFHCCLVLFSGTCFVVIVQSHPCVFVSCFQFHVVVSEFSFCFV